MSSAHQAGSTQFSVAELLTQASADTGLDDFGDDEFREGLSRIVDSTNREIVLSPIGAAAFQAEINRMLVNRLRFADDLKKRPEIRNEDLSAPVIVLGLPRTGTTKLQRMLASDTGLLSLKFWQTMNPARFPDALPGAEDPRIAAARQALDMMTQLSPGMMQSHPMKVDDAEEEIFLQLLMFKTIANNMAHPAPAHFEWASQQSMRSTYQYMFLMLQYLQWQAGGRQGRRWILKTPLHIGNLDFMNELFPGATYVFPHRDPRQSMPSFCRLVEMFWRVKTDNIDLHAIGRFVLGVWAVEMNKYIASRDRLGSKVSVYDVPYAQVRDEPLAVMREIYRRAGLAWTPGHEKTVKDWEQQNEPGQYGNQGYSLEKYGLTAEAVDTAFSEYRRRYLS